MLVDVQYCSSIKLAGSNQIESIGIFSIIFCTINDKIISELNRIKFVLFFVLLKTIICHFQENSGSASLISKLIGL